MKFLKSDFRGVARVFLGIFLLSPFLIWIWQIPEWNTPEAGSIIPAVVLSLRQAFLSAAASMAFGFILFLSLQGWSDPRSRKAAEIGLLLPNMIPSLFLALGLLNLVTPFVSFPFGLGAVIVSHVLLNAGLVAISLDRLMDNKVGGIAETSWILGASRFMFWRKVAWPYLRGDLASLFLFVFSICFTSFSLPLLLSGKRAVTLEVAIYDSIRMEGRWDKAVMLAALQASALFLMAMILPQPFWPQGRGRGSLKFLGVSRMRLLVFFPALVIFSGWLFGFEQGFAQVGLESLFEPLIEASLTTLLIALAVGFSSLFLFLLIAYVSPHPGLKRFLNGYLAPSPVITGFALLLIPLESDGWNLLKAILALTMISLPLLYRWIVHSSLVAVEDQILTARTLGASWFNILIEIVWPQTSTAMLRASGLAALWASGDFALSGILLGRSATVPLMMEHLIANYRMEAAQLLMIPLVVIGLIVYFMFVNAGRYVSR